MNEYFDKLMTCNQSVDQARQGHQALLDSGENIAKPSAALVQALADRGILQTNLGFASAGLLDLLTAYFHEKNPQALVKQANEMTVDEQLNVYLDAARVAGKKHDDIAFSYSWLEARLGEALRVYARDILLSQPMPRDHDQMLIIADHLKRTIDASIACFDFAEAYTTAENLPWIGAHCAAALTMKYWTELASGVDAEDDVLVGIAKHAEDKFKAAVTGYEANNPWCKRFYAFLLALRGRNGDFRQASQFLEECLGALPYHDSTIDRHQAMLFNYDTQNDNGEIARRAALSSLDKSLQAVRADSEDYIASSFGTSSLFALSYVCEPSNDKEAGDQRTLRKALPAALEAARVRSINTISQARATLFELALITAITAKSDKEFDAALKDAAKALAELELIADLETRCMFMRSMVWQFIRNAPNTPVSDSSSAKRLQYCNQLRETLSASYNKVQMPFN